MTDKEITREYNPINRIEVFKKRTDDFFATYENSSGNEDSLEVCLIRDGCRAVTQAEETINRLQAENENYSKNNQQMTSDILKLYKELEQAKEENKRLKNVYKQCAWQRDCFEADNKRLYEIIENKNIKLEENDMSSTPWGNETERADYYRNQFNTQFAICKRLDEENEKLKTTNASISKEIIDTKVEMYKQCIEEMREKIVNTPFDVDLTGNTNEYQSGYLDGLVDKQNHILNMLNNLLKEMGDKE